IHQNAAPDLILRQSFQTANKEFHVIDSYMRGIIVPYKAGEQVITRLCRDFGLQKNLIKEAQRYSVNLFEAQFMQLRKKGALHQVQEGVEIYYLESSYYSDEFGWSEERISDLKMLLV
ncbi:MAG: CRISPR-associated helicase/endonuclease Cas3, partial [candidate division KSB1 bacterium]|nr:CRISPR-associated helicase/endonuclease Cas3 [candidate division KSB1 bacterium]